MGSGRGKAKRVQAATAVDAAVEAEETTGETTSKGKSVVGSLIPGADAFIKHEFNVLIMGLHGTGKTETMQQLAKKHKLKLKYLSASTIDPYTDLVGIPVPEGDNVVFKRPRDIDECELLVIDEFNRAHPKVMNTLFELIQFKSINGEKLPNLKMVWAAMNPPGMDYEVEEVDPALLDRFDAYVNIKPKPSVEYMAQHMRKGVAQALVSWWGQHDKTKREDYISPRRLFKLGILFEKTGSVRAGLPPWGNFDVKKLETMLAVAAKTPEEEAKEKAAREKQMKNAKATATQPIVVSEIKATAGWMEKNALRIQNQLKTGDAYLSGEMVKGMKKIGAEKMAAYVPILDGLDKKDLEAIFTGKQHSYKERAIKAIEQAYPNLDDLKRDYPSAVDNLGEGGNWMFFHPKHMRNWGP